MPAMVRMVLGWKPGGMYGMDLESIGMKEANSEATVEVAERTMYKSSVARELFNQNSDSSNNTLLSLIVVPPPQLRFFWGIYPQNSHFLTTKLRIKKKKK